MSPFHAQRDADLSTQFSVRSKEARASLRTHMEERGLYERDGWKIWEQVRHRDGRTELVLRPIHLHLAAPVDLECVVTIDEPGSSISTDCNA